MRINGTENINLPSKTGYAFKCLECNTVIGVITAGSTTYCNCENELTVTNVMGRIIIKAEELDKVVEKNMENGEFYPLVY